ncbi:MAG: DUF1573 domain-containing protein [Planctomycetaceae bacterium]
MQAIWATRRTVWFVFSLALGLAALDAGLLSAAEPTWAEKMFDSRTHDFGVVARAAKVTHRFKITNLYQEVVHIARVRTTCGCSVARPSKTTLASGEVAFFDVTMDTVRFRERKSSVLTVVFDRPLFAEVHIPVKAFIRQDVVLAPGSADFQAVPEGEAVSRTLQLTYAGRTDWTIKQIEIESTHLTARVEETQRGRSSPGATFDQVAYDVVIGLKATAPAGVFRGTIVLITDDKKTPRIPVLVEAKVESDFTVSPITAGVVPLGTLVPGRAKRFSIVIKGREDFRVEKIEADSDSGAFRTKLSKSNRRVHVIPLTVTAPKGVNELRESFTLTIAGREKPLTFSVYGRVVTVAP